MSWNSSDVHHIIYHAVNLHVNECSSGHDLLMREEYIKKDLLLLIGNGVLEEFGLFKITEDFISFTYRHLHNNDPDQWFPMQVYLPGRQPIGSIPKSNPFDDYDRAMKGIV